MVIAPMVSMGASGLKIGFAECFLKYDSKNGATEIILYDVRPSRRTVMNKKVFAGAFDLSEFSILDLQVKESGNPSAIRVVAKAKSFLSTKPIQQLFSSILATQADVQPKIDFPQQLTHINMPTQKGIYFADHNALGVYKNEKETQVMMIFDTAEDPLEIVIGWKQSKANK